MKTAIIGTAGRDKSKTMDINLWNWMLSDASNRITESDHLVSGGAAWADHLAVELYINGECSDLTLHLPAPFDNGRFIGPYGSSASAANYYHERFSRVIGINTLHQIYRAICGGANVTYEPEHSGYSGMFNRNSKVSKADNMLAYTFGTGNVPADGGTLDTWNKCTGKRVHVTLPQ